MDGNRNHLNSERFFQEEGCHGEPVSVEIPIKSKLIGYVLR